MSEQILKALMQLFAILSRQDGEISVQKRNYVRVFLRQQVSDQKVDEYFALYEKPEKERPRDGKEGKPRKLTSVKDSVRTLSLCKKINKTLTQKQKIVVLVRMFELLKADNDFSKQTMALIQTTSVIFNISKEEYQSIESFVVENDVNVLDSPEVLLVTGNEEETESRDKVIHSDNLDGHVIILRVPSVNLYFLRHTGSGEVVLNGLAISNKGIYLFASGSTMKPSHGRPIYYSDVAANFIEKETALRIAFRAKNLHYEFVGGKLGIRDVSIKEFQGNLVGIMGASGAGKTTLLNVLSGIEQPSKGQVLINDIDLHHDNEKLKGLIGYVPQDDLLIEELTVYQNLYYNAKLCFRSQSDEEIEAKVLKVLENLGLTETKDLKVGGPLSKTISGGQRKRLNIGLELIREPSVLFLDEPTSGLSSRDSEKVLDLLRELTLRGKLIFTVIHQPSSDLYKMFDKIIFLDQGGYQIFYGNPVEAITYFKTIDNQINSNIGSCPTCGTVNPEIVFNIVEAKVVDEFGQLTDERKVSPAKWNDFFQMYYTPPKDREVDNLPEMGLNIPSKLSQIRSFFTRDVLSKVSNRQYMLLNLIEAPVLAFFLSFIIRYIENPTSDQYIYRENENILAYIFVSIIVALFLGLTVSAEEIYKDRKILKREKFLNLSKSSYLLSKLSILFIISAIQTLLFVVIGNSILEIKGMYFHYWLMLFTVSCLANVMGLNISASFNSAVTIYILIPLLIVPQMILGGAMFSYEKLNRAIGGGFGNRVPVIAETVPSRWAYEGLVVQQFIGNRYESELYELNRAVSDYLYKRSFYIPKLKEKLSRVQHYLLNPTDSLREDFRYSLSLLQYEIGQEVEQVPSLPFKDQEQLNEQQFDAVVLENTNSYLKSLTAYYNSNYNYVRHLKDSIILDRTSSPVLRKSYRTVMDNHHNEHVEDMARKTFNDIKIIEHQGRLIRQIDPIYFNPAPQHLFDFRAHFFSPNKHFLGRFYNAFYFNIAALWIFSILLYVALYFDLLKKFLDLFSNLRFKRSQAAK